MALLMDLYLHGFTGLMPNRDLSTALTIRVHGPDERLEFRQRGALTKGDHHLTQFLRGDHPVAVLVEHVECVANLCGQKERLVSKHGA